ncbi:heat shock 70 kDa protein 12A-like [Ruditapes philippinarum]|uniref:heat shock 70 kDa protein 12A-like n=1 Tax=Ruditapes philippinarum TaxID=129788 RepID=UPI00295AF11D|nr:heat shock 70 kDa protein 12A-like [Ruditapes philippinarum]XP_060578571.1 heat shock 70 kDa protein 12A-like [Ruditapes philippinarum]XP_060578572.1 heat shock 70 kDa protein 12A-like [Ruditapes philippinarum]
MGSKPSAQRQIIVPYPSENGQNCPGENTDYTVYTDSGNREDSSFGDPLLVTAIDFGTTYSGSVFCFKGYKNRILAGTQGFYQDDERIPTVILLNPDQTFNSFGYEAQDTYSKLKEEKAQYFYFEHFKMALYKNMESSSNTTTLMDIRGRRVKAKDIFVMLIKNLLHLAMDIVKGLQTRDIAWIVTIPASWSESSRKLVQDSVLSVGIEDKNLHFVLEPHAAAVYCMNVDTSSTSSPMSRPPKELHSELADTAEETGITVGDKCIILDIGGGSTDIWVYEVEGQNELKEMHKATEEIGGNSVNSEFIELMKGLVGEPVWSDFQEDYTGSYYTLMRDFDRKKRSFSNDVDSVTMSLENELLHVLKETTGDTLSDVITMIGADDKIKFKSHLNKVTLDKETMEELFEKSVDAIVQLIEKTLRVCQKWSVHTMFMVGGFSESPYLREIIRSKFSEIRVVFPDDAKLVVLRGAVILGYQSQ